mmetsp:Transcript_26391/g.44566  ORF Transcript_26391/g.44566 Transcript_26391/m.44566 type:complete len:94 (+) Transcript_26391:732-1013(+)
MITCGENSFLAVGLVGNSIGGSTDMHIDLRRLDFAEKLSRNMRITGITNESRILLSTNTGINLVSTADEHMKEYVKGGENSFLISIVLKSLHP